MDQFSISSSNVHRLTVSNEPHLQIEELAQVYQKMVVKFSCFDDKKSQHVLTLLKSMTFKNPKDVLIAANLGVLQDAIFGLHEELQLVHKYRSQSNQAHNRYLKVFTEFRIATRDLIYLLRHSL